MNNKDTVALSARLADQAVLEHDALTAYARMTGQEMGPLIVRTVAQAAALRALEEVCRG